MLLTLRQTSSAQEWQIAINSPSTFSYLLCVSSVLVPLVCLRGWFGIPLLTDWSSCTSEHDCSKLEKRKHFHWWGEGYPIWESNHLMLWPERNARAHTHTHTHTSLFNLCSHSFPPSLPRLFVMFHLPGLFECINQSSRGAIAITHLVRIREKENERESMRETEKMTERGQCPKSEREKRESGGSWERE